jgi:ribosome-associated protein
MQTNDLLKLVIDALEDVKGQEISQLSVGHLTTITDSMVFCSGTSKRHVKALSDSVIEKAKQNQVSPLGVEGQEVSEWILVDLGSVVVHVMMPAVREFYNLESLWSTDAAVASENTL